MGDLSRNFSSSEFACKCGCGKVAVQPELIEKLQLIRDELGRPMRVNSGYRCRPHNAAVGGKPESAHVKGEGVDIECTYGSFRFKLVEAALKAGFKRIGIAKDFVHLDIARTLPKPRIWVY